MPTTAELEANDSTYLAVLCGKFAESPKATPAQAEEARKLKHEWALLIASITPPRSSWKEEMAVRADIDKWKTKAAGFLAPLL